jgi:hypothetical protein
MTLLRSYEDELRESRKTYNNIETRRGGTFKNEPLNKNNSASDNSINSNDPNKFDQNDPKKTKPSAPGEFREAPSANMSPYGYPGFSGYPGSTGYPGGPGNPPGFPPYYPPYYPKRPVEPFGITAATLGIVSMCIFWLSIIPYFLGTLLFIIILSMSVLGIIFGAFSYANKMRRNTPGLVGLILSIIAIVLSSTVWSFTHMQYVAHYDMLVSFVF